MGDTKNKPGAGFWGTAVVVAILILYPLSFGPACWISSRLDLGADAVSAVYRPMTWKLFRDDLVARTIEQYSMLLAAPGWHWVPVSDTDVIWVDGMAPTIPTL
jgi:hypothetical protein